MIEAPRSWISISRSGPYIPSSVYQPSATSQVAEYSAIPKKAWNASVTSSVISFSTGLIGLVEGSMPISTQAKR